MRNQLANVLISILFSVMLSWFVVFTACIGNDARWCRNQNKYFISAGFASSVTMLYLFFIQLDKSATLLKIKRRSFPINEKKSPVYAFQYVIDLFSENDDKNTRSVNDDLRNMGWIIKFEDGVSLFVSVYDLSGFLLKSCINQKKIDAANKTNVKSPISQRMFPDVGRRKLRAYKELLRKGRVIVYHNANVERLKNTDPWSLVKDIRAIYPENKIIES